MRSVIFYFTATGNCLKVARDLSRELGGADIVSIPKAINQQIDLAADCIGIVYPVYMFGMPLIVEKFIGRLKADKDKYIFAIATFGSMAADTLGQNARLLKTRGLKLSAGFGIRMPGNYTPLYGALPLKKQQAMFMQEEEKIKQIAKIVSEKKENKLERGDFLTNFLFSGMLYKKMSPKIPFLDKDFWANEKCTSCGICARVCPVNNIKLTCGKPVWLHKCEQCFACLHWCPEEAIQYKKKTLGRKRYRNPEVKLEDLISSK